MNSHLTAIARKELPVPTRWLLSQNKLFGHILDYGCGKCKPVNDSVLAKIPGVESVTSYDPFYVPDTVIKPYFYNVILCTYVLCTIPEENMDSVLWSIKTALRPDGVAYISVRNDTPKQGWGLSKRGTFQRKVELPLFELRKCGNYRIYELTSQTEIDIMGI